MSETENKYGDRVASRIPMELKKEYERLTKDVASSPAAMTRKLIADWVKQQKSTKKVSA